MVRTERTLDVGDKIDCYRNLRKPGYFSCRKKGLVCGYGKLIILKNPEFIVSQAGYERFKRQGVRNVHAWVRGQLCGILDGSELPFSKALSVTYSPWVNNYFYEVTSKSQVMPFHVPKYAVLHGSKVYITNEIKLCT